MKWEDIKAKLSSRKFWVMIITFIGLVLVALNVDNFTTEKIIGVIASFSILAVYIIGETVTDVANRQLTAGETVVINMAKKLSSRKFWAALISFATTLMITLGVNTLTIEQVKAMIMAVATVAVYILGESAVDASKISADIKQMVNDIETEKDKIVDEIIGSVIPSANVAWIPMTIVSVNNVCTNVYAGPNYEETVKALANGTTIYIEPNASYGKDGGFYRFITDACDTPYFISVGECIDATITET